MAFADPARNIEVLELSPGMKVIDVGAGSGFYALLAARKVGESGTVYAVDIQEGMLSRLKSEAARQRIHTIQTITADLEAEGSLPLSDASTDAAIISNTLFLIEKKDTAVEETMRVLKPKSKILVIDWKDSYGGIGPPPSDVITTSKAIALFAKHGARLLQEFDAGDHHYGLLFQKT